jgi:hypothetical protein
MSWLAELATRRDASLQGIKDWLELKFRYSRGKFWGAVLILLATDTAYRCPVVNILRGEEEEEEEEEACVSDKGHICDFLLLPASRGLR